LFFFFIHPDFKIEVKTATTLLALFVFHVHLFLLKKWEWL